MPSPRLKSKHRPQLTPDDWTIRELLMIATATWRAPHADEWDSIIRTEAELIAFVDQHRDELIAREWLHPSYLPNAEASNA